MSAQRLVRERVRSVLSLMVVVMILCMCTSSVMGQTGTATLSGILRQWMSCRRWGVVAGGEWFARRMRQILRSVRSSGTAWRIVGQGILVAALILIACTSSVRAQTGTATLSGIVTDEGGSVVPNCEIQLQSVARGNVTTVKTNNDGIYVFSGVQPGPYNLTIRRSGFKQVDFLNLLLNTQDHIQQNFRLQVGSVSESITVNSNSEHMETDNPAVGLLVDRTFVENTPLNGRSFQDLIALAPGTVSSAQGNGLFSINGQHDDSNYFTVDGVAANINPGIPNTPSSAQGLSGVLPGQTALGTTQTLISVDALQEFKIQTSDYTAEYGRQPGGQIQLTSRSGTNDLHGSLFDYFRNDALDSNNWFLNQRGISRQPERQNDFGGTVGGPLEIPRIYDGKGKTFYFVSYEGLRLTQPQFSGVFDVPTTAFRQFAAPGVQPFLNAIPVPNGPESGDQCAASLDPSNPAYAFSCTAQWSAGYSNPSSIDSFSFRIDQAIGDNLFLFVRYADTPSGFSIRNGGSELDTTTNNTRTWTVGATANRGGNLLDEFRFNYSSSQATFVTTPVAFEGAVPYSKSLVLPVQYAPGNEPVQGGVNENLPIANSFYIPQYDRNLSHVQQYNLVNSLSLTHGRHAVKFGADYRRLAPLYNPEEYIDELNLNSVAAVQQGFADAAFIQAGQPGHPVFSNFSLYTEDHWRATRFLTVDCGLRWEFNPAPGASNGTYPLAVTTGDLANAQLAPAGTPQYHTIYHNFAPRFGFAYQVFPSAEHALVIRGGFGIFYDTGQAEGASGYAGYPFSVLRMATNVPLPASAADLVPPPLGNPLVPPYQFLNGVNDPNLKLPYTEQWNLSIDQGLSSRNVLTVSYVGNNGRKLLFTESFANGVSGNPAFTGLNFTSNAASSSYNALQIQDSGRVAPGMQLIASYTWACGIDDSSTDSPLFAPLRGNSDNDIRQILNVALNYQIPFASSNRFVRALTAGWSLDNRFTALTGYPVDIFQGLYTLPNGVQDVFRPDVVPGVPTVLHNVPGALGGWELNPLAFSPVPLNPDGSPARQGNLGRNFIHGPAFWNLNTAVQRNFPLLDRLHLIFRVEAFNIFNHPNAGHIDTFLPSSTFGQSGGAVASIGVPNPLYATGSARSLQLMLKLEF
jgi:hypothetical protein